jgi:hypothetical protein
MNKTLNESINYLEQYSDKVSGEKQDKSSFQIISEIDSDVTLKPNMFTRLDGVRDSLHILLENTTDRTTPVYNCSFMLGNASENNFSVDSYFGYDVL